MKSLSLLLLVSVLVTGGVGAQMDLAIGGSLTGGGNITIDVTMGPANSPFFIVGGDPGMTTIPGLLTIDLINPVPLLMVPSDQNGAVSLDLPLPNPMIGMIYTMSAQVVAIDLSGIAPPPGGPGMGPGPGGPPPGGPGMGPGPGGPPPGGPGMGPGPGGPPPFPFTFVKSDVETFSISL